MHPEVTDAKAGKCPKCGMALKPVKADAHEGGGHGHAAAHLVFLDGGKPVRLHGAKVASGRAR